MKFASIRIITDDIQALVPFYEAALGLPAQWANPEFAEISIGGFTLAIGSTKTLAFFGGPIASPMSNRSSIFEFLVSDVDRDFARIQELKAEIVQAPKTMPWGNRSLLFRDLDGNLVNFFTPVGAEAKAKFGVK